MATRDILLMIRENGGFWELQRKSRSNRNDLAGNLDARVKWSKDASDRMPRDAIGRLCMTSITWLIASSRS
jgi:hypothetical protein